MMESPIYALAEHLDELKHIRDNYKEMAADSPKFLELFQRKVARLNSQIDSTERAINVLIKIQKEEA
jgi:hypothetical protein